jgi:hypothetical protein
LSSNTSFNHTEVNHTPTDSDITDILDIDNDEGLTVTQLFDNIHDEPEAEVNTKAETEEEQTEGIKEETNKPEVIKTEEPLAFGNRTAIPLDELDKMFSN